MACGRGLEKGCLVASEGGASAQLEGFLETWVGGVGSDRNFRQEQHCEQRGSTRTEAGLVKRVQGQGQVTKIWKSRLVLGWPWGEVSSGTQALQQVREGRRGSILPL